MEVQARSRPKKLPRQGRHRRGGHHRRVRRRQVLPSVARRPTLPRSTASAMSRPSPTQAGRLREGPHHGQREYDLVGTPGSEGSNRRSSKRVSRRRLREPRKQALSKPSSFSESGRGKSEYIFRRKLEVVARRGMKTSSVRSFDSAVSGQAPPSQKLRQFGKRRLVRGRFPNGPRPQLFKHSGASMTDNSALRPDALASPKRCSASG